MANVQWKNLIPYGKLTFGQQAPPTFVPFTEYLWAYRSIEKTIMDMRSIGSSTDMGIQLSGKFDQSGNWGYSAMIGDGSNKKPEFDMYKKYYASINGFLFDHTVAVEGYFDYNPLSDSTHYMTWKLFAAYLWDPATVGIEYVQQPAVAPVGGVATDQDPTGLSIWARGKIIGNTLGYFARYDMWNPDSKYTKAYYKEGFATAGLGLAASGEFTYHAEHLDDVIFSSEWRSFSCRRCGRAPHVLHKDSVRLYPKELRILSVAQLFLRHAFFMKVGRFENQFKSFYVIPANAGIQFLNVTSGFVSPGYGFPRSRE